MRANLLSGVALVAIAAATPAAAQSTNTQNINTLPNGGNSVNSWGIPNTATYGQTITPTAGQTILTSFTFELNQISGTAPQFQADVYQWNGSHIVGPALFTSSVMTAPVTGANVFVPVPIKTGAVPLVAGQQYVLFFTTSSVAQSAAAAYKFDATFTTAAYPAGAFVVANNGQNFNQLSTTNWAALTVDAAFTADFLQPGGGENAADAQQGAFQLMSGFLGVMLDPFVDGRDTTAGGPALGFAPEAGDQRLPQAAQAYASVLKAPPLAQHSPWSLWGAAYGGYNRTSGNGAFGTHDLTTTAAGVAAGADYHVSPDTVVGFALGGGGTGFGVADGLSDGGHSDAFQAGVYGTTRWGPAYVAGALAYSQFWMTTDRTDLIGDRLRGNFTAPSFGERVEGGYRFATGVGGVTPYVAGQSITFRQPAFTETDLTAGGGDAVAFNAITPTQTRSELGARYDHRIGTSALGDLTFRGRIAWAHYWVDDSILTASFAVSPLAGFAVNGVAPPPNTALVTAGIEQRLAHGVSIVAKLEGELGTGYDTYAGTAQLKWTW